MPLESVRPHVHRRWREAILEWDRDPSTLDALILRLDQIAAGYGVATNRPRVVEDSVVRDWLDPEPDAVPPPPGMLDQMRQAVAANRGIRAARAAEPRAAEQRQDDEP